jgi:hypothetical protein
MGHAGAVVVACGIDEDLRLALQPAERLGMDDPVAVALKRRSDVRFALGPEGRPPVSYERTASGERASTSNARIRAGKESATRPASSATFPD